jgi:Lrp/AsnC family transcriptional regulator, regulator for asnA, asnC and gidA
VEPKIDDTDLKIIAALQEDGRRTYGEIGEIIGLSEPATRQRVHRLREADVLRIVALTDPVRLGLRRMAQVLIRVNGDVKEVARKLAKLDTVEYVIVTTGSVDIIIEIVCEDEQRLFEIINEQIRAIRGVRDTETLLVLHIEKQVFSWGARAGRDPSARQGDRGDA